MKRPTAREMIEALALRPLPGEGGFFRETYRGTLTLSAEATGYGERSCATAIYYFLTPQTYSALHRLRMDEVYHYYDGDPVELFELDSAGELKRTVLGGAMAEGQIRQHIVAAGVWQGSRLLPAGQWALLGTTTAPGFDFRDCELAGRDLLSRHPAHAETLLPLLPVGA